MYINWGTEFTWPCVGGLHEFKIQVSTYGHDNGMADMATLLAL